MRVHPLNFAKLAPPRRGRVLPRPRLNERIHSGLTRKLTVVLAGAGFGKTTLLVDAFAAPSIRVAWYRLDETDQDVAQFVSYLVAAIRQFLPEFGRDVQRAMPRLQRAPDMPQRMASLLGHALSASPCESLMIVLDSFDLVSASADVTSLLAYVLRFSPPHIHFVLASRAIPALPLAELRLADELVEFGNSDLAFTPDEMSTYLTTIAHVDIAADACQVLFERTEGWPAGVALVARMLESSAVAPLLSQLASFSGEIAAVYDNLAEEVFAHLAPDVQHFLLYTGLFDELYADACDHLLATTDARERLMTLQAQGLFTQEAVGDGAIHGHFRYHRLFRDFLRERLRRSLPADELASWLEAVGRIMEARGAWQSALSHYLEGSKYEAAANTLERVGLELLDTGAQQAIIDFLGGLPAEIVWRRPWLLALRGRILRRQFRLEVACEALDCAAAMFASARDHQGLAWVVCEMAAVDFRRTAHGVAVERLQQALTRVGDAALRAEMLVRLASNQVAAGKLIDALATGKSARAGLAILPATPYNDSQRLNLLLAEGLALAAHGHGDEARRAVIEVDALGESEGIAAHSTGSRLGHIAEILLLAGDPHSALHRLERAEPLLSGDAFWLSRAHWLRGDALVRLGDLPEAARAYELAGPLGWTGRAFLYVRLGRPTDALRLAELAWAEQQVSEHALIREGARVVYAIALRELGAASQAVSLLTEARRFFAREGHRWHLAGLDLHLARALIDAADPAGHEMVCDALQRAVDDETFLLPWWEPRMVADLCVATLLLDTSAATIVWTVVRRLGQEAIRILNRLAELPTALHAQALDAVQSAVGEAGDVGALLADLKDTCADHFVRADISRSVGATCSARVILCLRRDYRLTWREIHVLLVYYLEPGRDGEQAPSSRQQFARALGMTENTLKVHVANLRRKLVLVDHAGARSVVHQLERMDAASGST